MRNQEKIEVSKVGDAFKKFGKSSDVIINEHANHITSTHLLKICLFLCTFSMECS